MAAGNVFVADRDASVVRKIAANGTITTVAGNGTPGFAGDGGAAASAQINGPFGLAVDAAGNLYIADTGNNVVRKVSPDGTISTVAGTGTAGYLGDGGAARNAVVERARRRGGGRARATCISPTPSTAGSAACRRTAPSPPWPAWAPRASSRGDGGPATSAGISLPPDVAADRAGNLYIADFGNSRIRMVTNGDHHDRGGQAQRQLRRSRAKRRQRRGWKAPPA